MLRDRYLWGLIAIGVVAAGAIGTITLSLILVLVGGG